MGSFSMKAGNAEIVALSDMNCADGTTVISCHFHAPGFGKVVRYEGRRYWQAGV